MSTQDSRSERLEGGTSSTKIASPVPSAAHARTLCTSHLTQFPEKLWLSFAGGLLHRTSRAQAFFDPRARLLVYLLYLHLPDTSATDLSGVQILYHWTVTKARNDVPLHKYFLLSTIIVNLHSILAPISLATDSIVLFVLYVYGRHCHSLALVAPPTPSRARHCIPAIFLLRTGSQSQTCISLVSPAIQPT